MNPPRPERGEFRDALSAARLRAGAWAMGRAGVRQIHIVGCSRSGTTMLHVAMSAFRDTVLWPHETPAQVPRLREQLTIAGRAVATRSHRTFLITKRGFRWFLPDQTDRLVEKVRRQDMGLIMLVRDPRDVMSSRHRLGSTAGAYVDPDHWTRSILAGEKLSGELRGDDRLMVLRYEDLVLDPQATQAALVERYGLVPRNASANLGEISANLKQAAPELDDYIIKALSGVRDMDAKSVGKWRRDGGDPLREFRDDPQRSEVLSRFSERHGYSL